MGQAYYTIISNHVYEATITFTGIGIKKKARNVGVIMDDNLSLSCHINEVCKNATPAIRSIRCTQKYLSYDGLEIFTYNVYLVLINALVIYNSVLYGIP